VSFVSIKPLLLLLLLPPARWVLRQYISMWQHAIKICACRRGGSGSSGSGPYHKPNPTLARLSSSFGHSLVVVVVIDAARIQRSAVLLRQRYGDSSLLASENKRLARPCVDSLIWCSSLYRRSPA